MKHSVNTFRSNLGDCTNNGVSSTINNFILIDEYSITDYEKKINNNENVDNILVLEDQFTDTPKAIPLKAFINKEWTMFGGNFIYTSDSRFPFKHPIKIFDRIEN